MFWPTSCLVFVLLSLQRTCSTLECPEPCSFQQSSQLSHLESKGCSNKTVQAVVCIAVLQFDHNRHIVNITLNLNHTLPAEFNLKPKLRTELVRKIDMEASNIETYVTHYCTLASNCTLELLLPTIGTYRTHSYTLLITELRELLFTDNVTSFSLSPIDCLHKSGQKVRCPSGKCFIGGAIDTGINRLGCSEQTNTLSASISIMTPDVKRSHLFSFITECYQSLCNNKSLVELVRKAIESANRLSSSETTNSITRKFTTQSIVIGSQITSDQPTEAITSFLSNINDQRYTTEKDRSTIPVGGTSDFLCISYTLLLYLQVSLYLKYKHD